MNKHPKKIRLFKENLIFWNREFGPPINEPRSEKRKSKPEKKEVQIEVEDKKDALAPTVKNIAKVRDDVKDILHYYDILRQNYPEEFAAIEKRYPEFTSMLNKGLAYLTELCSPESEIFLTEEKIRKYLKLYNFIAKEINIIIKYIGSDEKERMEKTRMAAAMGEIEYDLDELTEEQKQALREYATDLWDELFANTYTEEAVKFYTEQKELEDWQKLAIAPAKGIEYAITGIIDLADPDTYKKLYNASKTIYGLSEEEWIKLYTASKFTFENLDRNNVEKTSAAISLIFALCFLRGTNFIGKLPKLTRILTAINPLAKLVPIQLIVGTTLPYFKMT